MSSICSKRQRDNDFEAQDVDWERERERKKLRPLPFRASPTSKHTTLFSQTHQFLSVDILPTITPVESSDDDENGTVSDMVLSPRSQMGRKDDMPFLSIRVQPSPDTDSDLEMTDQPRSSNNFSPLSTGLTPSWPGNAVPSPIPHHLITQSLNISGGRTATPIYGHFTTDMKVDAMSQRSDNANNNPPSSSAVPAAASNPALPSSSSRDPTAGEDWSRRRRLPSPISEDEISPTHPFPQANRILEPDTTPASPSTSTHCLEETSPNHASSAPQSWTTHALNQTSTTTTITSSTSTSTSDQYTGISNLAPLTQDSSASCLQHAVGSDDRDAYHSDGWVTQTTTAPLSPPAAHDMTPRPGKSKIIIAMGFRSDCDKCQRRVPGHYSHIIRG
ncbi:hypothetical protein PABG_01994 [Paracoccidioides brasiliensis Pb03]|nr:hypothetical protein PABG_01994 [Paracoccidioides brasiliensis Pb03]